MGGPLRAGGVYSPRYYLPVTLLLKDAILAGCSAVVASTMGGRARLVRKNRIVERRVRHSVLVVDDQAPLPVLARQGGAAQGLNCFEAGRGGGEAGNRKGPSKLVEVRSGPEASC